MPIPKSTFLYSNGHPKTVAMKVAYRPRVGTNLLASVTAHASPMCLPDFAAVLAEVWAAWLIAMVAEDLRALVKNIVLCTEKGLFGCWFCC